MSFVVHWQNEDEMSYHYKQMFTILKLLYQYLADELLKTCVNKLSAVDIIYH